MVDYWGAKADPNYGYSPYSGQLHYGQHEASSEPFTSKAGDGNNMTIEEIRARIHNMHPERISALGDQWQNAWTVLDNVRTYVLRESTLLHDERWESPQARDAFLRKGPGDALAYLDVWMDAVQKNVIALRHLVQITIDARRDIDNLWTEYEQALQNAQKVDFAGQLSEWVDVTRHYGFENWGDSKQQQIKEQVDQVTRDFQRRAQELAYRVGAEHYEYTSMVSTGVGPPYRPMDAVLNKPGMPAMPGPPSLPPGTPNPGTLPPGVPPPPPPGQQNKPPALPPGADKPAVTPPNTPSDGPEAPVTELPPNPGTQNSVNPPTNQPVVTTLPPPPPPALSNPGVKPPVTSSQTKPGPAPSKLSQSATPPAPNTSKPPNPGQLTKNSFAKGPGGGSQLPPNSTQPPGKTLRRPNVPADPSRANPGQPQPGRPGERGRDDRSGGRTPVRPTATDDAFGRPTGNTAPPVLKNPTGDRDRARPGSRQELRPTAHSGGDTTPRDGTTPPVLQRPTRGAEPPVPSRRRPADTTTGPSWLGAEEARAAAGNPVIDAPAPPPSGGRVSRLEEVPKELRSRAATRPTGPARVEKPGTVAPELSRRRVGDERTAGVPGADDEARGVVTDEQAFEVQTPGGGVVTGKREEAAYEPEIRRILGGR